MVDRWAEAKQDTCSNREVPLATEAVVPEGRERP